MDFIANKSNEDLVIEFERIINRMHSYSASGEGAYKEKLSNEILKRLTKVEKRISE